MSQVPLYASVPALALSIWALTALVVSRARVDGFAPKSGDVNLRTVGATITPTMLRVSQKCAAVPRRARF